MLTLASLLFMTTVHLSSVEAVVSFDEAQPVWIEGREEEMNLCLGFRSSFDSPGNGPVQVRITASTLYRLYVNGAFAGHGPARGPRGFYRVDEWDITPLLRAGKNVVAVEVAGYNSNSYYVLDQPSFLQAEVISSNEVLAATGAGDNQFKAHILSERLQKVQRYSFQRPFIEVYSLKEDFNAWLADANKSMPRVNLKVVESKALLPRGVPYPLFPLQVSQKVISEGTMIQGENENPYLDRSLMNIGPKLKGFVREDLAVEISEELCHWHPKNCVPVAEDASKPGLFALETGEFRVLDLGCNLSGFVYLHVDVAEACRLYITFDEQLDGLDVNWRRLGCVNALTWDLAPGSYNLEAFEPHTLRYMKVFLAKGRATISHTGMRLYENPEATRAQFTCSDERLNQIFEAGRTTFAQNAVDIFMDCPHRERAGWLCDSYFTARAAQLLCGNHEVERCFLENYLLAESFPCLPEGMLPMCYPADHYDEVFIPNWAMWFVMELGEFANRSDDPAFIARFQPRVEALFKYFEQFENEEGLLEKLESWVFVEWSAANKFVQDLNYPSNMLYAGALETAARLFDVPAWKEKSEAIKQRIREQSGQGLFFVDNAMRGEDGRLVITDNRTEVCQYFAFYFGIATPENNAELWRILQSEFGADRMEKGLYPEIHPANAFIGNMLRFELLSQAGFAEQLVKETADYLMYMVERTGTLWENIQDAASLNHGFASHITVTLFRDVLGLRTVNTKEKIIHMNIRDISLDHCKASLPVADEFIHVAWKKEDGDLELSLGLPEGYKAMIENNTGLTLRMQEAPAAK
ncbi:MAG: hypothetical protein GX130_07540 [Candidatus Hydrogenedens sp.]|jgi:alpha-L-rhamnosidase|nr:hypothetical protein [Candidatus Hydrogenedens sp.]